jgi:hypothetical protein
MIGNMTATCRQSHKRLFLTHTSRATILYCIFVRSLDGTPLSLIECVYLRTSIHLCASNTCARLLRALGTEEKMCVNLYNKYTECGQTTKTCHNPCLNITNCGPRRGRTERVEELCQRCTEKRQEMYRMNGLDFNTRRDG